MRFPKRSLIYWGCVAALVAFVLIPLPSQTLINAKQISLLCNVMPGQQSVVIAQVQGANVRMACAVLGPGLTLSATNPPVLSAATPLSTQVVGETPGGTVDGTNTVFTVAHAPMAGTVEVFRNGVRQTEGVDYTLSSATVTFLTVSVPGMGDILRANYNF